MRISIISLCLIMALAATTAFAQVSITVDTPDVFTQAEEAINEAVQPAIAEVEQAQARVEAVREALKTGKATQQELAASEEELTVKNKVLETSRAQALAAQSGMSEQEITAMRASGKGWGVIAKEAGVHPSALGKAKGKGKGQGQGQSQNKLKNNGNANKNKQKNKGKK